MKGRIQIHTKLSNGEILTWKPLLSWEEWEQEYLEKDSECAFNWNVFSVLSDFWNVPFEDIVEVTIEGMSMQSKCINKTLTMECELE